MKIVCVGDSLTKGYGIQKHEVWVHLAQSNSPYLWLNHGIAGDSSSGLLSRLDKDCFKHAPKAAILMGGTNDFIHGVPLSIVCSNMASAVHHCHHYGVKPYLGIPILCDPVEAKAHWGEHIDFHSVNHSLIEFRKWAYLFSKQFFCGLIDFQHSFENSRKEQPNEAWLLDGLHPSPNGHTIMAQTLPNQLYKTVG